MVNMGVDINFTPSYFKKLGLKTDGYEDAIDRAVDHGLHESEVVIKKEAPRPGHGRGKYYQPTGNLQRSISKRKTKKCQGELISSLKNPAYWVYVQYGTGAHTIKAKNGKFLVFETPEGKVIRTKKVEHPGMPANPFITRTKNKVLPKMKEYFIEEFKREGIID